MTDATALDDPTVASSPSPTCLEMIGVSKQFGGHQALEDVSITLSPGRVLALCGANGAGKSTLVRILAGRSPRTPAPSGCTGRRSRSMHPRTRRGSA